MKGFILTLIAILLFTIIAPIGFIYEIIYLISVAIHDYFFRIAISIDQLGNVVCGQLFNAILIKKDQDKFGNPDETISSVLGKNKQVNNLTIAGKLLSFLLNTIQNSHVEKAIEKDEKTLL